MDLTRSRKTFNIFIWCISSVFFLLLAFSIISIYCARYTRTWSCLLCHLLLLCFDSNYAPLRADSPSFKHLLYWNVNLRSVHPSKSINHLSYAGSQGWGAGANHSWHWARGGVTPGPVALAFISGLWWFKVAQQHIIGHQHHLKLQKPTVLHAVLLSNRSVTLTSWWDIFTVSWLWSS